MVRGTLALYSPSPCPSPNQQSIEMKISTFLKYTNYTSGETIYVHLLHTCCLKINPSVTPSNETAAPEAPPHVKCGASPELTASMGARMRSWCNVRRDLDGPASPSRR